MNIKELSKAKQMRPFRPFVIHLTSGKDLSITDGDQFALNAKNRMVFVFGQDDAYHLIDAREIASLTISHR